MHVFMYDKDSDCHFIRHHNTWINERISDDNMLDGRHIFYLCFFLLLLPVPLHSGGYCTLVCMYVNSKQKKIEYKIEYIYIYAICVCDAKSMCANQVKPCDSYAFTCPRRYTKLCSYCIHILKITLSLARFYLPLFLQLHYINLVLLWDRGPFI